MSQLLNRVPTADDPIDFAVRLEDTARESLAVRLEDERVVVVLRSVSLNRKAVFRWLGRHEIPCFEGVSEVPGEPLRARFVQLPTLVVCVDSRVRDIAECYARSVGASLSLAQDPAEVFLAIEEAELNESLSLFLLNDRLEEELCHAITLANRRRRAAGRAALTYGFFTAFTPEQLAWLVIKSWAMFLKSVCDRTGFARYNFSTGDSVVHVRSTDSAETSIEHSEAPWLINETTVLGLRTHGAAFDVSMGHVVLCGQLDPPLSKERTLRAPSCFHDNVCFRLSSTNGGPTQILKAVEASPILWCLYSCASVPLTGNAFGEGTSYVFGLIAGAAVGVIGPFLDITTSGAMNHQCEALLATGATLGETVAAVCSAEEGFDFDRFILIGSPDLHLLPTDRVEPRSQGGKWRYLLQGKSQYAWRLAIPPDLPQSIYIVGDDGGSHWAKARCYWLNYGLNRDLLVILDEPTDVDGWLIVGSGGRSNKWFGEEATRIEDNLKVLTLCPFVDAKSDSIKKCQSLARLLQRVIGVPDRVRCRVDATILWANLKIALDELHQEVADEFLRQVAAHDVNLDRVPARGFDLEPTARTSERCPTCGVALYVTQALWRRKRSYVRRWIQCVNCSGVSMILEDGPLVIQPAIATVNSDGSGLSISVNMRNRTEASVQALIAGLARKGSLDDAVGPVGVIVPPNSSESFHFTTRVNSNLAGVISYRLLVLCDAGVELLAFKHVVEPN
jgi:hypothetical protein